MMSSKKTSYKLVTPRVVSVVPANVGRRRRRRQGNTKVTSTSVLKSYVDTLNDPFDCAPPRLGYGTFLATNCATAYIHGTTNANADGSFSICFSPTAITLVSINNNGLASTLWAPQACTNLAALQLDSAAYRVVSGGIRACPLVASTSIPGLVYAGTYAGIALASLTSGLSSTNIAAFPSAHIGLATYGATGLLRPVAETCIEFLGTNSSAYITQTPWASPVITFQTLPPSTPIAWEAVLNIEMLPGGNSPNTGGSFNRTSSAGTLSSSYPVFSSLFNLVRERLSDPIRLDFSEGGPSSNGGLKSANVSMFGSANARSAKLGANYLGQSHNFNDLAKGIRDQAVATGLRMESPEATPEQSYADSAVQYVRETVIPTVANIGLGAATGVVYRIQQEHLRHRGAAG